MCATRSGSATVVQPGPAAHMHIYAIPAPYRKVSPLPELARLVDRMSRA